MSKLQERHATFTRVGGSRRRGCSGVGDEHDRLIGKILELRDELGIGDSAIGFYSSDTVHMNARPDGSELIP